VTSPFAYPVCLDLRGRRAVVVGEDAVAQGKADALLEAGAEVTVVAEGPAEDLARLAAHPRVTVRRRPYRPGDLAGAFVCVASSPRPEEREAVFREARRQGVLLNVMDDPARCDFAAPAVVRRGHLVIAVSTGGRSPALARWLRIFLGRTFGPEWGELLDLVGSVREETAAVLGDVRERARRWRQALDPAELLPLLKEGRRQEARGRLLERLGVAAQARREGGP
jgi:precorrin-2 dehydrogenase/sirohydrochlorin ferrochelatase